MNNVEVSLFALLWIACGIGGAGFSFSYWQSMFPEGAPNRVRGDLGFSLLMGIWLGPVFLVIAYFLSGFGEFGWRLRHKRDSASCHDKGVT